MERARNLLLLALLCFVHSLPAASALSSECLAVPAVAEDVSASKLVFMKNGSAVAAVCPGTTYGISLTFPQERSYQLISTRGAFENAEANCVNRVTRAAASTTGHEKLYLGCAATGSVQVSMVSSSASVPQLIKSVTWQIKALSECPASPCSSQQATGGGTATSTPPTPAASDTGSGNTVIHLTGSPMADLNMIYQLVTASASPFKIPTSVDAATAFELIAIVKSMQDNPTAENTVDALQKLLNLLPTASDPTGLVAGMKTFLSVMAPYVSAVTSATTGIGGAAAGSTGSGALDMLSSLASLGGVAGAGTAAAGTAPPSAANLLSMLSSFSSLASAGGSAAGTAAAGATEGSS